MKRALLLLLLIPSILMPLVAFDSGKTPKTVTLEGTISAVSLVSGEQMCFLMVRPAPEPEGTSPVPGDRKVMLGSMRYLIDQGFNPKAGDAVKVVAFPLEDNTLAAARIELPARKQKIQFRDDTGRPVWSSGRGIGPGMGGPGLGGPGMGGGRGGGRGPRSRGGGR